ncbi:hypothetical protein E2562_011274 [Oryza meyeriana var. granulata]|uniref:Pentacotripeptide-repeat region of PRORP domain-containing protein n=1 Tax=Oryza meyeriana var. granulata TaxID=110450 RepID=A0A6G1BU59_9ORYZ|nr:hypothetical protein E2562_011274 [Oryza meyeriana var. granulata]
MTTTAALRPSPPVATLLGRCRTARCLAQLHARIVRLGLHNHHALLARFAAACDALASPSVAASLLSALPSQRDVPIRLRNAVLASLARHAPLQDALAQYNILRRASRPDAFSFPPVICACARAACLPTGASLHAAAIRLGLDADLFVRTALIQFYGRCGAAGAARALFDSMAIPSEVSWTAIITVYINTGDILTARELFDQMPHRNVVHWNVMVDGYVKCGDLEGARKLFDEMPERTPAAYTSLIGCAQNGYPGEALKIFDEFQKRDICPDELVIVGLMSACSQLGHCLHGSASKAVELFSQMLLEGITPDNAAFTVVLTACSHAGLVEEGKRYFDMMKNEYMIIPSGDHYACLVSLLGRFGMLGDAYELIKSMPGEPHPGAWGALLGGCKLHCDIELGKIAAKKLFEIEPDNAGNYVSLSNIYANIDRWGNVSEIRAEMTGRGVTKIAGRTLVLQ